MESRLIRKISIGSDVNNALHISVSSKIGGHIVAEILNPELKVYEVWVHIENNAVTIWKTIENMPVMVEYNTRVF